MGDAIDGSQATWFNQGCGGKLAVLACSPIPASPPPTPAPPAPPPSPPKSPYCATPIDFALVLDESGSMKDSMEGSGGLKAFAKELVSEYSLGEDAARFAVVSFAADATTRVQWSYDAAEIGTGVDEMTPGGSTSISDGLATARQLFADDRRSNSTKLLLLLSDGEQTTDAAPGKTPTETAVDAAALAKADGITVFAWGAST